MTNLAKTYCNLSVVVVSKYSTERVETIRQTTNNSMFPSFNTLRWWYYNTISTRRIDLYTNISGTARHTYIFCALFLSCHTDCQPKVSDKNGKKTLTERQHKQLKEELKPVNFSRLPLVEWKNIRLPPGVNYEELSLEVAIPLVQWLEISSPESQQTVDETKGGVFSQKISMQTAFLMTILKKAYGWFLGINDKCFN